MPILSLKNQRPGGRPHNMSALGRYNCLILLVLNIFLPFCVQVNITTYDVVYPRAILSSEWELARTKNERTSKLYSCCPNPFVDVQFKLVLRRRPTFASHLFIAPSVMLCLITPTVFLLPTASYEKLTLGKFIALFTLCNLTGSPSELSG